MGIERNYSDTYKVFKECGENFELAIINIITEKFPNPEEEWRQQKIDKKNGDNFDFSIVLPESVDDYVNENKTKN